MPFVGFLFSPFDSFWTPRLKDTLGNESISIFDVNFRECSDVNTQLIILLLCKAQEGRFARRGAPFSAQETDRASFALSPEGCNCCRSVLSALTPFMFTRHKGVSKQNRNRKPKIEMILNKALIGPCSKHVPLRFLGSEKMNDLGSILTRSVF